MARGKRFASKDPTYDQTGPVAFHHKMGSKRPATTIERRVSEVNTQRFAAGSRGGTTAGQGPALDSK